MGFTTFGLSDQIMDGIRAAGHTAPTPIQSLALLPALEGKDVVASAQTGTGKTAAFVLPVVQRLSAGGKPVDGRPRALVLTPTRELAQQIQDAVSMYGRFLTLRSVSIYGGAGMDVQLNQLLRGVDIIVATPGRLLDHLQRGSVDLSSIQVLVLDEADRMLDMGFIKDVTRIIDRVPKTRQTLLFSATLSDDVADLAGRFLRNPQTVEAGGWHKPVETITQHFYSAARESKMGLLIHAVEAEAMKSVLVFSRTKHGADKICRRLGHSGVTAMAIHSNRTQAQREKALDGFKKRRFRVLVATDIAARGIDVSGISHVINFDVPQYPEDFIHRIGRTGRAGASGDAITLISPEERPYLARIQDFTGKHFAVKEYPGAPVVTPSPVTTHSVGEYGRRPGRPHPARGRRTPKRSDVPVQIPKKRQPPQKLTSYSSDQGGRSWSNY